MCEFPYRTFLHLKKSYCRFSKCTIATPCMIPLLLDVPPPSPCCPPPSYCWPLFLGQMFSFLVLCSKVLPSTWCLSLICQPNACLQKNRQNRGIQHNRTQAIAYRNGGVLLPFSCFEIPFWSHNKVSLICHYLGLPI